MPCVVIGMARRIPPADEIAALRASYKESCAALALIREVVEELAPPGSAPKGIYRPNLRSKPKRSCAASGPSPIGRARRDAEHG